MVRASGKDAHWAPSLGGVSGTSSGEETSGKRTRWRDYISTLAWERLGIPPSELVNVAREGEVWGPLLELPPPATRPRISGRK